MTLAVRRFKPLRDIKWAFVLRSVPGGAWAFFGMVVSILMLAYAMDVGQGCATLGEEARACRALARGFETLVGLIGIPPWFALAGLCFVALFRHTEAFTRIMPAPLDDADEEGVLRAFAARGWAVYPACRDDGTYVLFRPDGGREHVGSWMDVRRMLSTLEAQPACS